MECEFCKKNLSSLSNLNYHKKTNKSCQLIQNKNKNNENKIIESSLISCEFCDKIYTFQIMKTHLKTCKQKKKYDSDKKDEEIQNLIQRKDEEIKSIIEKKDEEIKKLMEQNNELSNNNKILSDLLIELKTANEIFSKDHEEIIKIANKPTGNKINILNNNFSFNDPEKIKLMIDSKLTKNHIVDGQKGVAQFAYDTILKDDDGNVNYFCTDPSRGIFKFQNINGEFEKDVKAKKLTTLLFDAGIKTKSTDIANDLWTNDDGTIDVEQFRIFNPSANEIIMMQSDNTAFRNELACLTSI
jgi:hypothetical protein